jgi:hypothetical protein
MSCEIVEQLERINRLSEVALEFHGEFLGEVAAHEVVGSSFDLSDLLDEEDNEELEDEGDGNVGSYAE